MPLAFLRHGPGRTVEDLPRDRDTVRSEHHLFYPAADFRRSSFAALCHLPCARLPGLDSRVHSIIHQICLGIVDTRTPQRRAFLNHHAQDKIDRHHRQVCGCYQPQELALVDAFTLGSVEATATPPCTQIAVDQHLLNTLLASYRLIAQIAPAVRSALAVHHDQGKCGCWQHVGSRIVYRPAAWQSLVTAV